MVFWWFLGEQMLINSLELAWYEKPNLAKISKGKWKHCVTQVIIPWLFPDFLASIVISPDVDKLSLAFTKYFFSMFSMYSLTTINPELKTFRFHKKICYKRWTVGGVFLQITVPPVMVSILFPITLSISTVSAASSRTEMNNQKPLLNLLSPCLYVILKICNRTLL